jgi:hypothetical protein
LLERACLSAMLKAQSNRTSEMSQANYAGCSDGRTDPAVGRSCAFNFDSGKQNNRRPRLGREVAFVFAFGGAHYRASGRVSAKSLPKRKLVSFASTVTRHENMRMIVSRNLEHVTHPHW